MSINPIRLEGNWEEGFAIDFHVIKSVYTGENEYGRSEFITTRSVIGELVYQLKYQFKEDKVYDIIKLISPFLNNWEVIEKVDVVIPVPPTNKTRAFQPVFLISEKIAEFLNKPIALNLLEKVDLHEMKNLTIEEKTKKIGGSIIKHKNFLRSVNVLLVDDLYKSGTTLNEACIVLRKDKNVDNIYVLAMTKTKG